MEDNSYYPAHNIFETIMAVRKCVKCGGCMGCPYYNKGNLQCTEKKRELLFERYFILSEQKIKIQSA